MNFTNISILIICIAVSIITLFICISVLFYKIKKIKHEKEIKQSDKKIVDLLQEIHKNIIDK